MKSLSNPTTVEISLVATSGRKESEALYFREGNRCSGDAEISGLSAESPRRAPWRDIDFYGSVIACKSSREDFVDGEGVLKRFWLVQGKLLRWTDRFVA